MFITEKLINIIAPHTCLVCNSEGKILCNWCRPDFCSPLPSRCYSCHALTDNFAVCESCKKNSALRHVWVVTEYNANAKVLLEKLKFNRANSAALEIATFLDETLPFLDEKVVMSHLPTATSRRRQRGYDQSELIAGHLAAFRGLPHKTLLMRNGQSRQVGASRQKRIKQMDVAFTPVISKDLQKATILLIDDLTTTGSSLESAARVLKKAGVKKVYAATFAQKL